MKSAHDSKMQRDGGPGALNVSTYRIPGYDIDLVSARARVAWTIIDAGNGRIVARGNSKHGLAALRDVLTALTHAEGQG